jgi:hypothetical protein
LSEAASTCIPVPARPAEHAARTIDLALDNVERLKRQFEQRPGLEPD